VGVLSGIEHEELFDEALNPNLGGATTDQYGRPHC